MRTNMKYWSAKRMLCLTLCILMLVGIAMPSVDMFALGGKESLLGRLFGVTEALAAESDVTTWTASGTCEWGIDPDGCLWIRPANGSAEGTLGVSWTRWGLNNTSVKAVKVINKVYAPSDCRDMFSGMSSCTSMDLSGLDTSSVTTMNGMFNKCSSLTSLDISGFDTRNVEIMSGMFDGCSSLTSLDVSGFDTSSVGYMIEMFRGCSSLISLDVSSFDTSNVTSIRDAPERLDPCKSEQ